MFEFLRKPGMRRPTAAIRRALEADGLPPGTDVDALGVVGLPGRYAGRAVTFIRVFDPQRAADRSVDVFSAHTFEDLNAHRDLVLRDGFVEQDGAVVIFARRAGAEAAISPRERSGRPAYPGARLVFPAAGRRKEPRP